MGKDDPVFLCEGCIDEESALVGRFYAGAVGADGICAWCGALAQSAFTSSVDDPQIGSFGSFEFSPSLALDVVRRVVYDTNGFYRCLGVRTDATKREIREAFQRIKGWTDPRSTYAAKVLLNAEARAEYDALEPPDMWFDPWIRAAVEEELRSSGDTVMADPDDEEYRKARSLKEDLDQRADKPVSQGVDKDSWSGQNLAHPSWGHYVWRTMRGSASDLAQWRCELALAMRERGVTARLSVGFARGIKTPWAVRPVGHRPVAYLGVGERPTQALAAEAVEMLHRLGYTTSTNIDHIEEERDHGRTQAQVS